MGGKIMQDYFTPKTALSRTYECSSLMCDFDMSFLFEDESYFTAQEYDVGEFGMESEEDIYYSAKAVIFEEGSESPPPNHPPASPLSLLDGQQVGEPTSPISMVNANPANPDANPDANPANPGANPGNLDENPELCMTGTSKRRVPLTELCVGIPGRPLVPFTDDPYDIDTAGSDCDLEDNHPARVQLSAYMSPHYMVSPIWPTSCVFRMRRWER